MYPNPVSEQLSIETENQVDYVQLIDISGRIIKIEGNTNHLLKIPVKEFNPGMYFVIVHFIDKSKNTAKILIE